MLLLLVAMPLLLVTSVSSGVDFPIDSGLWEEAHFAKQMGASGAMAR